MKSSLSLFPFASFCFWLLFHLTVVLRYLVALDRSFAGRELADSGLMGLWALFVGCDGEWGPGCFFFLNLQFSTRRCFLLGWSLSGKRNPFLSCQLAESSLGLGL